MPASYSPPSSPGQFYYVSDLWGTYVTFNGTVTLLAYQKGFEASAGSPNQSGLGTIILDFGRQGYYYDEGRNENVWGNWLLSGSKEFKETSSWVKTVYDVFMQGYNDNPNHGAAMIAASTNTSNHPWECGSANWYYAGQIWGTLLINATSFSKVTKRSANDIESWYYDFRGTWFVCGYSVLRWFDGYQSIYGRLTNINFGSNAYGETSSVAPSAWSHEEQWQVAWGGGPAVVYPEIYCPSHQNQWLATRQYKAMRFDGVTPDNAYSTLCGFPTYTFSRSWNELDYVLRNAPPPGPYINNLLSAAIIPR